MSVSLEKLDWTVPLCHSSLSRKEIIDNADAILELRHDTHGLDVTEESSYFTKQGISVKFDKEKETGKSTLTITEIASKEIIYSNSLEKGESEVAVDFIKG